MIATSRQQLQNADFMFQACFCQGRVGGRCDEVEHSGEFIAKSLGASETIRCFASLDNVEVDYVM